MGSPYYFGSPYKRVNSTNIDNTTVDTPAARNAISKDTEAEEGGRCLRRVCTLLSLAMPLLKMLTVRF